MNSLRYVNAVDAQLKMGVAVVGAGTMGVGIAQTAAIAGHRVVIVNTANEALARGASLLDKALTAATNRGIISLDDAALAKRRVFWKNSLDDTADAGLVIEAIVERLDAKTGLLLAISAIVSPDTILASNTCSLALGSIAAGSPGAKRAAGLHFFNPVPAMKLVEIVAGPGTLARVVDELIALMIAWGVVPSSAGISRIRLITRNCAARRIFSTARAFAALKRDRLPSVSDSLSCCIGGPFSTRRSMYD